MAEAGGQAENMGKLRLYAILALAAVVLALLSFLIAPNGSGISSCDKLVFASSKSACITSLALAQANASICNYVQGTYEDSCYAQVAGKLGNVALCKSVQQQSSRDSCVSEVALTTGNYSSCMLASEPTASDCEETIGLSLNNLSVCSSIPNLTDSMTCRSVVNIRRAKLTDNPGYCANVTGSANGNVTGSILSKLNESSTLGSATQNMTVSPAYLFFIPNVTYTARDYCYFQLAQQLSEPALCSNVSVGEAKRLCIMQANLTATFYSNSTANYTQLLASCTQLGSYSQVCTQAAQLAQAVGTRNATLCGKLQSTMSLTCYAALASKYMNATYCNYIQNATEKSACVGGA